MVSKLNRLSGSVENIGMYLNYEIFNPSSDTHNHPHDSLF
jgi:hypothetical protein